MRTFEMAFHQLGDSNVNKRPEGGKQCIDRKSIDISFPKTDETSILGQ